MRTYIKILKLRYHNLRKELYENGSSITAAQYQNLDGQSEAIETIIKELEEISK